MLHIILAESPLELIPESISKHKVIRKYAKRRGKKPEECLLDSNFHHVAMKNLEDFNRRGRPDIVHVTLLYLLSSIPNKEDKLRVYVHTLNDEVIFIKPETRLPRSYNRFIGLIEQVMLEGKTPNNLLFKEDIDIKELISRINPDCIILMDEKGENDLKFLISALKKANPCIIIGAFPHGGFKKSYEFADKRISLYREALDTLAVAGKVLCLYESVL